jgi:hypothetical protein
VTRSQVCSLLHVTPPRPGSKNFFELATQLPHTGVGAKFSRNSWGASDSFWQVTRVRLKVDPEKFAESQHGKAWGTLTWRGVTDGKERQLRGVYKRLWKQWPAA